MNSSIKKQRPSIIQKWLFQKLFLKILNNWLWILISVATGFTIALLINRYTNKIYRTKIEVVKGNPESDNDNAAFLFSNPYESSKINVKYERSFITSMPVMEEIIKDLNLQVTYYSQGRVKTTRRFAYVPVKVDFEASGEYIPYNIMVGINPVDDDTYTLNCENEEWQKKFEGQTFRFGMASQVGDFRFIIHRTGNLNEYDWLFLIQPMNVIANKLQNSIRVNEIKEGYYGGQGNVSMLELSMTGSLPQRDKMILDRLIKGLKIADIKRKNERSERTIKFIEEQLEEITDSMQIIAAQMRSLKLTNKELSAGSSAVFDRITSLEEKKNHLLLINRYSNYLEDYIKSSGSNEILAPSSFGIENGILGGLVTQYIQLKLEQQALNNRNYSSQVYRNEKKLLEEQLKDLENMILESIQSTRNANELKISELEAQVEMLFLSARSVLSNEIVYSDFERLYGLNEKVFTLLMDKKAEAGITRSSIISDYRVLEPATTIYPPLKPRSRKNYMTGIFLGLAIPVGFFFFQILKRNTLLSLSELEELIDLPLAGVIGHSQNPRTVMEKPQSLVSENFRSLRSNLRFVNHGKDHSIFVVTSSVSAEGKTFISSNLAAAMAIQGKKVVLIGADMRKPTLHNYFNHDNKTGLSQFLTGQSPLEAILIPSDTENLDVIYSGPTPPNPAELLSGEKMKKLIDALKDKYDIIFIDTPPIGLISDASELFNVSNSILLVTRQQKTPIGNLQHIDHFMEKDHLQKTLLVFNGVRKGVGYGYYGYGYGYGYGYYEEEAPRLRSGTR